VTQRGTAPPDLTSALASNAGIPLFGFPRPRRPTFSIPRKTVAQQDGKAQHRTITRLVKLRMLCHVARRRSKGILLSRATLRRPPYAGILRAGAALGRPLRHQTFPAPVWSTLCAQTGSAPPSFPPRSYPRHGAENWARLTPTIAVASERASPPCGTRHDAGLACGPMRRARPPGCRADRITSCRDGSLATFLCHTSRPAARPATASVDHRDRGQPRAVRAP
jgi:hypothetical protein